MPSFAFRYHNERRRHGVRPQALSVKRVRVSRGFRMTEARWKSAIIAAAALLMVAGMIVALTNLPVISGVVPN